MSDPLAPRVMPGGDTVCGHCDSGGKPSLCPYHAPPPSGAVGLMQVIPGTWADS